MKLCINCKYADNDAYKCRHYTSLQEIDYSDGRHYYRDCSKVNTKGLCELYEEKPPAKSIAEKICEHFGWKIVKNETGQTI